jgi:hypothetical protein
MKRTCKALVVLAAIISVSSAFVAPARAQSAGDPGAPDALQQGFVTPPDSAKPRTWWHWTNGNVTKEGITKDLEWMKRVGIAGMQLADVASGSGQTIEKKLIWGSPEWLDAVHHAASEADRLGLEMSIFSSAGWSETAGPWVKPEQAMKKLVWSETVVNGPKPFDGKLAQPPSNNGTFGGLGGGGGRGGAPDPTFYGDSAVIAYRTPSDETTMEDLHPKVTASSGEIDGALLMDGNLNTAVSIQAPQGGGPAWVQYEFPQPIKAMAVTLVAPGRGIPFGRILSSDDGASFRPLVDLPGPTQYRAGVIRTYALPAPTTAKFFRVEMTGAALEPAGVMNQVAPQPAGQYSLSEFTVHTGARVNRWQEKAGFNFYYEYQTTGTPAVPSSSTINRSDIVDLTSKMNKDGTLNWDVPAGKWTILRMGYSLTGAKNRPAPAAGTGYEVDKLSRKYVQAYFKGYTDPIFSTLGPLVGKSLRYMTMDSFEGGMQNWTDEMIGEFQKRRGYDPTPYLPVLAGRVVESADVSDRFLWDFRRTIADLLAESHYGTMSDELKKHGMGIYGEANGVSMEFMEDTLLNKSKVEIPMGEFWVRALHPEIQYYVDVRGAASASHAYGKKLVATETFTGGGYEAPFNLKRISDYWLAQGVNRLVFHTSAQQPLDTKPGNTMVGTHINRNITWAEQAKPLMTYLARNMYMLQQGLFVADLAYLLPEGAPSSQSFWGAGLQPTPPMGYDYDCINTDVLLNRMTVGEDGRLMLPDGMSYRVLVLPQIHQMTVPVLKKIRELVAGGATVVGPRATRSPSLTGYPDADVELQSLAADVWGDLDGVMRNERFFEKGRVIWGLPLVDVLHSIAIPSDFECTQNLDSPMAWIHRRDGETDIYFLANGADHAQDIEARFRVNGKEAEIWHSDTGAVEPADYSIANGRTVVPLHLAQRESVFVVFRHPSAAPSRTLPRDTTTMLATVAGTWDVSFPPNFGAPPKIQLEKLESWTANADDGVKYFSGTATYTKTLSAPQGWLQPGAKILLDLGSARDVVEVAVNSKPLGILWKPPYVVDVTGVLKAGDNQLEIKVTNEWTNRQAGDAAGPLEKRVLSSDSGARGGFGGGAARGARGGIATTQGAGGRGFTGRAGARGARGAGARGAVALNAAGRGGGDQIAPTPFAGAVTGGSPFGGAGALGESGLLGPVTVISINQQEKRD